MEYLIYFLEGFITFISPCTLPMLPIYIAYFSAGKEGKDGKSTALVSSLGFVLGFTAVFMALGVFASLLGGFIAQNSRIIDIISGLLVILFGMSFAGFIKIPLLQKTLRLNADITPTGFFPAMVFGCIFALGYSPCIGAFLGSALLMASQAQSALRGALMLLIYSIGLGIPFIVCALLLERLQQGFNFIKANYDKINKICGIFLILTGIYMMIR